ncbi:MAG: GNAT family N-acetyltransferase [Eubacteriales bacterium]|nr:GNAT family N-acetyltransferase [Eubacteriales bacterium]
MQLRKAKNEEFDRIRDFYWNLIDDMKDRKDTVGWKKGIYPTEQFIRESIEDGNLYIIDGENGIIASVIINSLWNEGYDGLPWSVDCPRDNILVPHALAVKADAQGNGIGKRVVQDIIDIAKNENKKTIRLDILDGNIAAERLYTGMGFQYVQSKNMFYEDTGWTSFSMYELIL